MINKYQQGGAAPQQGGGILAQIQQLPQEQQQQLMQAFAQWAQQKGVDIQQLQSNPQALEQALGMFMQEMQTQQAQAAKHGAKLQYIKNLKHQCAADEELQFFKAGGQVGCKCVKKQEKGGKQEPKKNAIDQFKAKKGINLKKDKCGGKMKKHQIGGTIETLRQSLGLEKNITKAEGGLKFGGSNKSNRFIPQPVRSIPETTVNGIDRRWHFDSRQQDLGNGYGMQTDVFYDYYNGGNQFLGDSAIPRGGRTIYKSPHGNDTLYWNTPAIEDGWYKHVGNMLVGPSQPGAKANFFRNLKRPLFKQQYPN